MGGKATKEEAEPARTVTVDPGTVSELQELTKCVCLALPLLLLPFLIYFAHAFCLCNFPKKITVDTVEVSKLYEVFMEVSGNGETPLDKEKFRQGLGMLVDAGLNNLDDSPFADRCADRHPTRFFPPFQSLWS
jgi:hypothetical protein